MPLTKRRKLSVDENIAGDPPPKDLTLDNLGDEAGDSSDASEDASDDEQPGSSDSDSLGTEDEIAEAQRPTKSKKTQKRKRRATSPSQFGATLQSLLGTDAPTNLPLSLKPSVAKKRTEEILEVKAKKLLEGEKKEKEERNHVTDVIGGWGGESERSLRKVAQRGVVKLFNMIQQTQAAAAATQEQANQARGSGKPRLPAPVIDSKVKAKKTAAAVTSAGKSDAGTLGQDDFLQMIKSGGVVSKA